MGQRQPFNGQMVAYVWLPKEMVFLSFIHDLTADWDSLQHARDPGEDERFR